MQFPVSQVTTIFCLTVLLSAFTKSVESRSVHRRHTPERMIRESSALKELKDLVKQCNSEKMSKALRNPNIFSQEFQLLRRCLTLLQILRPENDVDISNEISVESSTMSEADQLEQQVPTSEDSEVEARSESQVESKPVSTISETAPSNVAKTPRATMQRINDLIFV
ncbi:unnamed protein product [Bursaphelenchus okinawaensis]|uniref:Uncharacterized protein n=1 Tax=Bursaphelenchus okinawaensis TaxID=465554 RepID=A0A811K122_9BILA|nr:unnamed protein product [Bursaphelenchus okinawaensis]CAG9089624.1 unnamed protein product [Bursaphelenchus okinawaensis]